MNPQSLNPYVYCMNNPMKYIDPDGRECLKPLQEMYGFDSSATLEDYALFFGIVSLFFGGGEIYFVGKATIEGLTALGAGRASTIGGILSHWSNTQKEARIEWIKEHKNEIEDWYYDPEYDNFYFKLNNEWTKLTFKKDFFGNWDVETVDVQKMNFRINLRMKKNLLRIVILLTVSLEEGAEIMIMI